MINIKELRIGNFVKDSTGNFILITSIHSEGVNLNYQEIETEDGDIMVLEPDYSLDQIEPIPLTTEILEKCGFEINDGLGYCSDEKERIIYDFKGFYISFEDNKFFIWNEVDGDSYFSSAWPEIKYLHMLQNKFYFDKLTGEELEIKEPVNQ